MSDEATRARCRIILAALIPLLAARSPAESAPTAEEARRLQARRKLTELILHHPMAEISHGFTRMVRGGRLRIDLVDSRKDPRFDHGGDAVALLYEDRPGCGLCPVFKVSDVFVLDPHIPDEWRFLVLWHEGIHLREAESGQAPWIKQLPLPEGAPTTEAHIELIVKSELRAYASEYDLAASLGWEDHDPLGAVYREHGPAAMACHLAEVYQQVPLYFGHEATVRRAAEEFGRQ